MAEAPDDLDRPLTALANRHRREIVRMIALHPDSISRLAQLRGLSLPAINKHVRVLNEAGLVERRKLGRTTYLVLRRAPIVRLQAWLGEFHAYWGTDEASLENYEQYLATDPRLEKETP